MSNMDPGLTPGHVTGPASLPAAKNQRDATYELQRARPTIPQQLTDFDDVVVADAIFDGQQFGYDFASGNYVPMSRQIFFAQVPPGVVVAAGSTDALDLAYSGVLRRIHVRVTSAGSGDIDFAVYLNGVLVDTLTLAAGQLTGQLDFDNVPVATTDRLVITTTGGDAVGLVGWILV